jgi:glyoxylase-like metal-dependent hydrolase (beta-lactamase superfamily II)
MESTAMLLSDDLALDTGRMAPETLHRGRAQKEDDVDEPLQRACEQVRAARASGRVPDVRAFFDQSTNTASYVIADPSTRRAAIVDSVLDFDPAAGRISTQSAEEIRRHVEESRLSIEWLLETHAHADHLSAAPFLQSRLGGQVAIGREITSVQEVFRSIFNAHETFAADGSDFDHLFDDGDAFAVGAIPAMALYVPGHTPADVAYVIGDAVFTGDTMFMPDYGTARADFPGGDARRLYRSIRRLLSLPDEARLFLCHDYMAPGRDRYAWETTVGAQRTGNVHVHAGVDEDDFVAMRTARDATLSMPQMILPAVQVNMRAGKLPDPEANGVRYLRLPLDAL